MEGEKKKKFNATHHTFCQKDKSYEEEKSPSEHKQVHKFTKVASGGRENKYLDSFCHNDKSYQVMKSNLPPEHMQMHKFPKLASGEREKQISCHSPHVLSER